MTPEPADRDPADLPPTARRILAAAQDILAERGYSELTMTAISQVSGVNRALVSYYFGGKAGLLAALVDTLFQDPEVGLVEEIRATATDAERTDRLPGLAAPGLRAPTGPTGCSTSSCRTRCATRRCGRGSPRSTVCTAPSTPACLGGAPRELSEQELEALAAVSIAVVEGLGIQRALDPDGFDHEAAWRAWRDVVGAYLALPGSRVGLVGAPSSAPSAAAPAAGEAAAREAAAARRRWPPPPMRRHRAAAAPRRRVTPGERRERGDTPPTDFVNSGVVNQKTEVNSVVVATSGTWMRICSITWVAMPNTTAITR